MSRARRAAAASTVLLLVLALTALVRAGDDDVELASAELTSSGRPRVTFLGGAPDPHVLRVDDRYYAYATNGTDFGGGDLHNIQRYETTDLRSWTRTEMPDALPERPTWARQTGAWVWAPTVLRAASGEYVMFFVARTASGGQQCIGRAVADQPDGAFEPTGNGPVICQTAGGGSIDPYHFRRQSDGTNYLYWKNDGNDCDPNCPVWLWGRRLDRDGNLVVEASRPLVRHDRFWEIPVIENPAMTHSPVRNSYRLFYSGNWYQTTYYSTGYADCTGPLGPCRKVTTAAPWHNNTPYAKGPGGAAFFEDSEGKNWMAYHGYLPRRIGPGHRRFLFVDKVDLHRSPILNTAFPYDFHRDPPHPFVDVPRNHWAAPAISWLAADAAPFPAAATGTVVAGLGFDPDELFGPRRAITRAELLNWLWKLEGSPSSLPAHPFTDGVAWIEGAMDWAAAEGLMSGYGDNRSPPSCGAAGRSPVFRPSCPISRGEYVRLLWRLSGSPTGHPHPRLADVPRTSWVFDAVSWATDEGHMTGYADDTFRAGLTVTRAQVANALRSLHGA